MADDHLFENGGHRRIDRVLAHDRPDAARLARLPLEEVRALRADAEQEEADLSYLRRLLQGRIDILRAELTRRASGATGSLLADLPRILAADDRPPARGLGRHSTKEPSRVDQHRRRVERLVADTQLSAVGGRSDQQVAEAVGTFEGEERVVSTNRRAVQEMMDACTAELTRRYRDGGAGVDELLSDQSLSE